MDGQEGILIITLNAGFTGIYMTNSVIQKIVKLCGYCLIALTVAFLLEVTFEIMYEKLGKTAEYNGVYYLPSIDTYMEICYGVKDTCALIYFERGTMPEHSRCSDILQISKSRNGPSKNQKGYCDLQLFFTQSNACYISCNEQWREKSLSLITNGLDKEKVFKNKLSFVLKHPDLYKEQSSLRDSCKVTIFLSNELQTANVAYKGSLYGENLSTVKERKTSRFRSFLSNTVHVID